MRRTLETYDQVSKVVLKQRMLIAHAKSKPEAENILTFSCGFLKGMEIQGVIDRADYNTYVNTLQTFTNEVIKEKFYGKIPRNRCEYNRSTIYYAVQ